MWRMGVRWQTYMKQHLFAQPDFDHFLIMRALIAEGGVLLEEVGRTALTEAIRTNSISALITLLAQGVQPDQKSFQEATNYGNPRTLRILLRELWMTSDL